MLELQLQSRKPGHEWCIRSRLSDLNYKLRHGEVGIEQLMTKAELERSRWMAIEPETDFRVIPVEC